MVELEKTDMDSETKWSKKSRLISGCKDMIALSIIFYIYTNSFGYVIVKIVKIWIYNKKRTSLKFCTLWVFTNTRIHNPPVQC